MHMHAPTHIHAHTDARQEKAEKTKNQDTRMGTSIHHGSNLWTLRAA